MTAPHDDLDHHLRTSLTTLDPDPVDLGPGDLDRWRRSFDVMAGSRHLDLEARRMRERGEGFYTIGSAGHESNALVAEALSPTDPALLHYRSGAFYLARSVQAGRPLEDGLRDVLLGLAASVDDPASGGRHKVFGHPDLAVVPQTSTIASHLPRAVGVAFAIGRTARLKVPSRWPAGSVVVASFGDASLNHSTAAGALNTAAWLSHAGLPLPLVFVCEDNGLGISVPTPEGWVAQAAARPGLAYHAASGDDPVGVSAAAQAAVEHARSKRRPALLHLRTVRFLGHAGTDLETAYRRRTDIAADREHDPLLGVARLLVGAGADANDLLDRYDQIGATVVRLARDAADRPKLRTRADVVATLSRRRPDAVAAEAGRAPHERPARAPEDVAGGLTLAQTITATLADSLAARPEMVVFGEDVGRKGGVYGVTRGLQSRFGAGRVFDSVLDEQAILGLGLGAGLTGLLPVPEIQYLAYLHNAEDQLRGEAASQAFFSGGAFTNPMVVRVAGLAYQKGFGGHFHNDNAVAVLRDVPGLVVGVPAHPADAAPLLRTCLAAASVDGTVSVLLEPIALYHERDLHEPGDGGWLAPYAAPPWTGDTAPIGRGRLHGDGTDLTIVSFGNGLRMSLRVARRLAAEGTGVRVLDLRWINPLPVEDVLAAANATGRVLVADETRHAGGVGEGVVTALVEAGYRGAIARVASADSFVPLADAANLVLLQEDEIEAAARRLVAG
ncbi:thiamine pyrophosphate-dependent enzyme [Jatrophihabitans sp. YIM 134969]